MAKTYISTRLPLLVWPWFDYYFSDALNAYETKGFKYKVLNDNDYTITLDLPGYEKDRVEVSIKDDVLVVKAERDDTVQTYATTVGNIDVDKIDATLKNGVLSLHIVRPVVPQARKIQLKD